MSLVVLEGIDRSGRSTHAGLLEAHLRAEGRPVVRTALGSSELAGPAIRSARGARSHAAEALAMLYAADLAERLELVVEPALRAGQVVIADRWTFTPIARARVRGVDDAWLSEVFSFAPAPDIVLWLDVSIDTSLGRRDRAPHPYEAGLDLGLSTDLRESYRLYQARLSEAFAGLAARAGFVRVDADGPPEEVEPRLEAELERHLGAVVAGR